MSTFWLFILVSIVVLAVFSVPALVLSSISGLSFGLVLAVLLVIGFVKGGNR